jgi:xanthine permease XanP
MDRRASTIAAISLAAGLGVSFVPTVIGQLPPLCRDLFSSGIAAGGMCALCLNLLLPGREEVPHS